MLGEFDASFGELESAAVREVLDSGQLWRGNGAGWGGLGGTAADRLEDAFSNKTGLPYVHAVNSGTSANEAALASLGLQAGDEVICPAASPIFIPFAILAVGCIPVFADVDPQTLLLDPASVEAMITERTRALVVVHLWGMAAPMTQIMSIAGRYGLRIVEDCAQAFETLIDGRHVGTFGDACCYSLQQSKHISSGEGGIFATRNADGYARAVLYSNAGIPSFRFGVSSKLDPSFAARGHICFGHNHRISELQAAVALAQLSRIDDFVRRRAELVELLKIKLTQKGDTLLRLPSRAVGSSVSYWKCPVLVPRGRGTYVGIPYLEPVFRKIEELRVTPMGMPIPRYVNYNAGSCLGAEEGASQIRVVSVHHSLTDQELNNNIEEAFGDL